MSRLTAGFVSDGYRFLGGDPNDQNSWEAFDAIDVGDIVDGYRFQGGDPNDQENWAEFKAPEPPVEKGVFDRVKDFFTAEREAPPSAADMINDPWVQGNTSEWEFNQRVEEEAARLKRIQPHISDQEATDAARWRLQEQDAGSVKPAPKLDTESRIERTKREVPAYTDEEAQAAVKFDQDLERKWNKKFQDEPTYNPAEDGDRITVSYDSSLDMQRAREEREAAAKQAELDQIRANAEDMPAPLRGLAIGFAQSVAMGGGAIAYLGDLLGSEQAQKWGMDVYSENMDVAGAARIAPQFTDIDSADGAASWLAENAGYVAYQAAEAIASFGFGNVVGKQIGKEALAGALVGFLNNERQTLGAVYGDAVQEAQRNGQPPPNLFQVALGATLSAGVDTIADKFGIDAMSVSSLKGGMLRRVAEGVARNQAVQAGTEGVQLIPEEWGAGRDPFRQGMLEQYINEMAVGALGGTGPGLVQGIRKPDDLASNLTPDQSAVDAYVRQMMSPENAQLIQAAQVDPIQLTAPILQARNPQELAAALEQIAAQPIATSQITTGGMTLDDPMAGMSLEDIEGALNGSIGQNDQVAPQSSPAGSVGLGGSLGAGWVSGGGSATQGPLGGAGRFDAGVQPTQPVGTTGEFTGGLAPPQQAPQTTAPQGAVSLSTPQEIPSATQAAEAQQADMSAVSQAQTDVPLQRGQSVEAARAALRQAEPFTAQEADAIQALTVAVAQDAQKSIDAGEMPVYRNGKLTIAITPSAQNPGKIQVTRYSEKGALGDSQYNNIEDAIRQEGLAEAPRLSQEEAATVMGQAVEGEAAYQASQSAKPVKAYSKQDAERYATRFTAQGMESVAVPHPTEAGKYAVVTPAEAAQMKQAPATSELVGKKAHSLESKLSSVVPVETSSDGVVTKTHSWDGEISRSQFDELIDDPRTQKSPEKNGNKYSIILDESENSYRQLTFTARHNPLDRVVQIKAQLDVSNRNAGSAANTNTAPALQKGDRFTDSEGKTWEVWNARTSLIEAHPVVDGKAVVNRDSGQRFATDERARFANPEARTDVNPLTSPKGTAAVAQRQVNASQNFIDSVVEQFGLSLEDAGKAWNYYVKNKLVKVDSVGGQYSLTDGRMWASDALRKAVAIESAPAAMTRRQGKLSFSNTPLHEVQAAIKDLKLPLVAQNGRGGAVVVKTKDGSPVSLGQANQLRDATVGRTVRTAPKRRGTTGNLKNDLNVLAPGLFEEIKRGGDGEANDASWGDVSLIAEQLRDDYGYMIPHGLDGRDAADALRELVRQHTSESPILSEQRIASEQEDEQAKQHRAEVRRDLQEAGINTVARKFTDMERDWARLKEQQLARATEKAGEKYARMAALADRILDPWVVESAIASVDPELTGKALYEANRRALVKAYLNERKTRADRSRTEGTGRTDERSRTEGTVLSEQGDAGAQEADEFQLDTYDIEEQQQRAEQQERERVAAEEAAGAEERKQQAAKDKADLDRRLQEQPFEFGVGSKEAKTPTRDMFSEPPPTAAKPAEATPPTGGVSTSEAATEPTQNLDIDAAITQAAQGKTVNVNGKIADTGATVELKNQDAVEVVKALRKDIEALDALRLCIGG